MNTLLINERDQITSCTSASPQFEATWIHLVGRPLLDFISPSSAPELGRILSSARALKPATGVIDVVGDVCATSVCAIKMSDGSILLRFRAPSLGGLVENSSILSALDCGGNFFESLFNAPVSVVITDLNNRVTWANKEACRISQYSLSELINKDPQELCKGPNTDSKTVQEFQTALVAEQAIRRTILHYNKSNDPFWIDLSTAPFRDSMGKIQGFIGISSDITQIITLNRELELRERAAQAANVAKERLLGKVSHEMRTPLFGIVGALQLIRNKNGVSGQMQEFDIIEKSADQLTTLIDDLLDFTSLEGGSFRILKREFEILHLVRQVIAVSKAKAESINVELRSNNTHGLTDQRMFNDPIRLKQILFNLLDNAIKYAPGGIVELNVSRTELDCLAFEIRDNGIGIDPKKLPAIFTPFTRLNDSSTNVTKGIGLGLSLCKEMSDLMGARITVNSFPGMGSVFTLIVPMNTPPLGISSRAPSKTSHPGSVDTKEIELEKTLLVEDNKLNQMLMQGLIKAIGVEVLTVDNGSEAVDICSKRDFDLIIMDLAMPIMDGFEATQKIRLNSGLKKRPRIIALTAHHLDSERRKAKEAGMDGFITKPVTLDTLRKVFAGVDLSYTLEAKNGRDL